ncbi:hypothetical protein F5884DRAFT_677835 [Xylogone sp. PMI_703]|nr:hypothetical protein F5884DRAFT_677835 [Xylogone sp. PMI_703]
MSSSDQTIGLPQLVIILVLGGLAIRYFFFSSPEHAHGGGYSSSVERLRAREADVERIQQMFPQIPRRSIMWDLQRNGGNVAATTERILSGMGLENPPQSFQPAPPPSAAPATAATTATSAIAANRTAPQPDLITRYNLQSKLAEEKAKKEREEQEEAQAKKSKAQAWSSNKSERQALLQRRRDEMILAARRKMEAKLAEEKATEPKNV